MRTRLSSRWQRLAVFAVGAALALGALIIRAEGAGNAVIYLKKDTNGLFLLTIKDPEGIREFSLEPPARGRYAGEIGGCPRTFQSANVLFTDPGDFTPVMNAYIVDCAGNRDDLLIPAPADGAARSRSVAPPEPPPVSLAQAGAEAPGAPATLSPPERSIARAKADLSYPIAELGSCGSEEACRAYCEELANIRACIDFAEKHSFATREEAEAGRRFAAAGGQGPGGCTGRDSCAAYCEDISHIEECLTFGERHGFLSGRELEEAKIVARLRGEGAAFPGGCASKAACEAYCTAGGHEDECIAFGERSGLIPPGELAMAKRMLPLIREGKTPGGCNTKAACEAYCTNPANMRQCIAFGEEHGLIPAGELEMAKKFLPLMEKGETPGGCRSKEACEAYCSGEGHFEECIAFGVKGGFISEADAELARRTGGKGPGDCKSREACEAFCRDPQNSDTCAAFAREHGIETDGPGGCKNIEECRAYCQGPAHQGECGAFAQERGLEITGPGGCRGKEQCEAYCRAEVRRDEFEAFFRAQGAEGGGQGMGRDGSPPESSDELRAVPVFTGPTYSADFDLKCDQGWNPEIDATGRKYCAIQDCNADPNLRGRNLAVRKDAFGRNVCVPPGFEGRPPQFDATHLEEQYRQQPGPQYQKPPQQPCPLMPTVDQCPPGMRKTVVHDSPACGTYYACVPEGASMPPPASSEDPAVRCAVQGGAWNGVACQFAAPPPPPPSGDPAAECISHGGAWTGTECRLPSAPAGFRADFWPGVAGLLQAFVPGMLR